MPEQGALLEGAEQSELHGQDKKPLLRRVQTIKKTIRRHELVNLGDHAATDMFKRAFGPELECLKRASASVESEPETQSNLDRDDPNASPSHHLYGRDFVEVNRTLMGMLALKWILADDYEAFTHGQPKAAKLSKESFEDLRKLFGGVLVDGNGEDIYCLLVATLVNDLGKDPEYYKKVEKYLEISDDETSDEDALLSERDRARPPPVNHDTIIYVAAEHDEVELVNGFYGEEKDDLIRGLQFGSGLNGAQLQQAENVPGSLEGALIMRGHEKAFEKKFLELILDVSGADGHVHGNGARSMIEPVFQGYMTTRNVLKDIVNGNRNLRQGYDTVLVNRGDMLAKDGFQTLDVKIPEQRALLRLLTMCRTSTKVHAEKVRQAFYSLDRASREALVDGLSVDGYNDGVAILPYYAPGMFAEATKATVNAETEIQIAALSSIMKFLSQVYCGTKPVPGQPGTVIEFDLAFAQTVVKGKTVNGKEFKKTPAMLQSLDVLEDLEWESRVRLIRGQIKKAKKKWTPERTEKTATCPDQCTAS
ncbi:MAG: hypothetical protein MMC33_008672 [Icmadophila ericetorum]|nr:hypothetical protein [Icmadophila ericetorum]